MSGFFQIDNRLFEYGPAIGPAGLAVYAALTKYADRAGTAFPSMETIARDIGADRHTVGRALGKLERAGLVEVDSGTLRRGRFKSNRYRVIAPGSVQNAPRSVVQNAPRTVVQNAPRTVVQNAPLIIPMNNTHPLEQYPPTPTADPEWQCEIETGEEPEPVLVGGGGSLQALPLDVAIEPQLQPEPPAVVNAPTVADRLADAFSGMFPTHSPNQAKIDILATYGFEPALDALADVALSIQDGLTAPYPAGLALNRKKAGKVRPKAFEVYQKAAPASWAGLTGPGPDSVVVEAGQCAPAAIEPESGRIDDHVALVEGDPELERLNADFSGLLAGLPVLRDSALVGVNGTAKIRLGDLAVSAKVDQDPRYKVRLEKDLKMIGITSPVEWVR